MAYCSQGNSIEVSDILCQMSKQQLPLNLDMELHDGIPLNFKYFKTIFKEAGDSKTEDPRGRLTRLFKYTTREAKELIKHCIAVLNN